MPNLHGQRHFKFSYLPSLPSPLLLLIHLLLLVVVFVPHPLCCCPVAAGWCFLLSPCTCRGAAHHYHYVSICLSTSADCCFGLPLTFCPHAIDCFLLLYTPPLTITTNVAITLSISFFLFPYCCCRSCWWLLPITAVNPAAVASFFAVSCCLLKSSFMLLMSLLLIIAAAGSSASAVTFTANCWLFYILDADIHLAVACWSRIGGVPSMM